MDRDTKIILFVQILSIILFLKGISATYHATKYAMENQLWIISNFAFSYKIAPLILLIPLCLIFLTLIINFKKRTEQIVIVSSILILFLSLGISIILF